jgi:hypothetical protein
MHQAIYKLSKRSEQTGSVIDLPRSGSQKTAVMDEDLQIHVGGVGGQPC